MNRVRWNYLSGKSFLSLASYTFLMLYFFQEIPPPGWRVPESK